MNSVRSRFALIPLALFCCPGPASAASDPEARSASSENEAAPQDGKEAEAVEEVRSEGAPQQEADTATGAAPQPVDLTQATSHTLKNDLEVTLQAIPGAPEVSVCTAIEAGSRLDPVSAPGAYRVLGEILKEGGYRSSSQDYAALVTRRGGRSEVTVTREATTFCTTVPAGELPLALWVTGGRFTSGALTEEALEAAVDELAKESEFLDAQVRTGRAPERLRRMAFLGTYEYAHPTLPNPDDLDTLQIETIRNLHRESYVAKRAKIAISGGFDLEKGTKQLSEHLYAAREGTALSYRLPELVNQTTARFSMAEDRTAKTPAAWYGWIAPADEKRRPLEIALSTLVNEKRLGGQLVGPGRAAKSIDLSLDEEISEKGYGLARLEIVGSSSRSLGTIEKGFEDQLKRLVTGMLTAEEIAETQRALLQKEAARLTTSLGRARELARGRLTGKSAAEILLPLKEDAPLAEVSVEDVRAAALSLLATRKQSTIEIYPKGWQDPWQEPMRLFHVVSSGETLGSIASRYGTTVPVIEKMNSIKRNQTIYPGDKLRVPRGPATTSAKKPRTHTVRRGDTLSGLALKYGVSTRAIADANGMGAKLIIRTGETLQIPWGDGSDGGSSSKSGGSSSSDSTSSDSSSGTTSYTVKSGDTLSQIAARHGVSTVALARANGISHKAMVRVGQVLKMPPRGTGKGPTPELIVYTVQKGDTLSGIAKKHGVSVAELTVANQMSRNSTIRPGQKLQIPKK